MELFLARFAGFLSLLSALPAFAQDALSAKDCVPCGKVPANLTVPIDPLLLVAIFAIGLVAGVAIGLLVARKQVGR
jgi:hypothetical protein